uniref:Uncharacterized protein n=1 Tax=Dunaliella tertiolecta TaxID=3047 RepID=A0A6S8J4L6_DUNTE|mmetsp:Transcript_9426/g.25439  ORF Transcript_9426/g.25439 Transcript_9426/m.25439 type:complete len:434 (+) Transcript_9426:114-1415(+)|eukprot:CAMPEP_0202340082 /NCGR_PEP_ID=MMETSP1126-20121109/1671_1 /ASSEMBLY_ACC=CAM_ASM_000457 /TAXON_ID=3047 /ORGANISM="Dunaliella tertiolecta, Strain CCMP1320" /LENGTH=433 /DNA_ID=CAMNT_0048930731 /DNA_START=33 /DNA_END=1334 /DNA_ORIENTATION=+
MRTASPHQEGQRGTASRVNASTPQARRDDLEELPFEEGTQDTSACERPATQQQQSHALSSLAQQPQPHSKQKLLTPDLALRLAQKNTKAPLTNKDIRQLVTLRANGLGITGVQDMLALTKLETLYLYDNLLENTHGISALQSLTHLYLANNKISDMSELNNMPCLQKLYLQGNHISLVCGLRGMMSLEELQVSDQKLPEHASLQFDPFAVQEVAHSLRKLVAVNSNIKDECLSTLSGLRDLRSLELGGNALSSFEAIEGVVEGSPYLLHIDLKNNPICKNLKYRETMIIMSDSLRTIDGHEVLESQRQSLLRLQVKKMKMEQRAEERALRSREAAASSATTLSEGLGSKPLSAGSVNTQAAQFVQSGGLRGATASGRSDLIGSPAGYGQPRHFAKQASQHQPQTMSSPGGQRGLGVTGSASTHLAGALDGLQL